MAALHFLGDNFQIEDWKKDGLKHEVELFEHGGELFVRVWAGGIGENNPVCGKLSKEQASELSEAANSLSSRIAY